MKKLGHAILSGLLALAFLASPAFAQASWNASDITKFNNGEPPSKNARDHGYKHGHLKVVFDPSAVTGDRTIAAHTLATLPAYTCITKAYYKVLTTFTSATDAGTIALAWASANDITTATAISAGGNIWDAGGLVVGTPTGALSNEICVTADTALTATVAVEALTAGKLVLWVEYVYFGDV